MRRFLLALFILAAPLGACGANTFDVLTTPANSAPVATTLAEAEQAATLVTQTVDLYVKSANPSQETLYKIMAYSNTVHAALVSLEQDRIAGRPLVFATYNSAVAGFQSYLHRITTP